MKIIIYGAGALGSVIGGLLTRRHDITLVGREAHMTAVAESGLSISCVVEGLFLPHTATELKGDEQADAVIVTVKAKDLGPALDAVRPVVQR